MAIFPYFGLTNSFNIEGVEDSILMPKAILQLKHACYAPFKAYAIYNLPMSLWKGFSSPTSNEHSSRPCLDVYCKSLGSKPIAADT